jgi:hypothetical protein
MSVHRKFGWHGHLVRACIIAIALVLIALELGVRLLALPVRLLIRFLRLHHIETYLQILPLWFAVPIVVIVLIPVVILEIAQYWLLAHGQFKLAVMAHVGKYLVLPVLSHVWRIYSERLLQYQWVQKVFAVWCYGHEWLHSLAIYQIAVHILKTALLWAQAMGIVLLRLSRFWIIRHSRRRGWFRIAWLLHKKKLRVR